MNKAEYFKFHDEFCAKMRTVTQAKNSDYTGAAEDPFANFSLVEKLGIGSVEQGFLTRMSDKLSRIISLVGKEPQVITETMQDTLHDLANYCALFAGYLASKAELTTTLPLGKVYEVIATSERTKVRTVLNSYPDYATAAGMIKFHSQDWGPNFGYKLTVEEAPDDDQDTEPT